MFDRHEVVLSNGAWTESLQPGDGTFEGTGKAQRIEIRALFPELKTTESLKSDEPRAPHFECVMKRLC